MLCAGQKGWCAQRVWIKSILDFYFGKLKLQIFFLLKVMMVWVNMTRCMSKKPWHNLFVSQRWKKADFVSCYLSSLCWNDWILRLELCSWRSWTTLSVNLLLQSQLYPCGVCQVRLQKELELIVTFLVLVQHWVYTEYLINYHKINRL